MSDGNFVTTIPQVAERSASKSAQKERHSQKNEDVKMNSASTHEEEEKTTTVHAPKDLSKLRAPSSA